MEKLAALVPIPRVHLTRFHGCLAPNAKIRVKVVQQAKENKSKAAQNSKPYRRRRLSWAQLMRRVFQMDLEACTRCGGKVKILAAILDIPTMAYYLILKNLEIANRFTGNKVGLLIESLGMQDSDFNFISNGNIYENAVLTQAGPGGNVPEGTFIPSAGIFMSLNPTQTSSNGNYFHLLSQGDEIYNNEGWSGLYVEGARRTRNNVEILNNRMDIEVLGTRFVKLGPNGEFEGSQNQDARISERRDITIVGANNSNNNQVLPPPPLFTGVSGGNQVNLLMRQNMSSCMPTDYDAFPEPLVIYDNEPDEVEINFMGSPTAFLKTNSGWICAED